MADCAKKFVICLEGGAKVTVETENTINVEETNLKTPEPKIIKIKKAKNMTVETVLKALFVNYENSSLERFLCDVVKDVYIEPVYDVVVFYDKTIPQLEYFRFVLLTEKDTEISFGVRDPTRKPFLVSTHLILSENELK